VTTPHDLAHARQLVEQPGGVAGDAGRQDQRLQGAGRKDGPGELLDGAEKSLATAQATAHGLPLRQEPGELDRRDRLDLGTQGRE
jgi:hypothetical protein